MATTKQVREFTTKQQGDACEMLIAAELTLAGVPAAKMPDNWPNYDLVAQPLGLPQQTISVRSRTFSSGTDRWVDYDLASPFDWLAVVLLPSASLERRRIFIVPKSVADERAPKRRTKYPNDIYWSHRKFVERFPDFEDNFKLSLTGNAVTTRHQ